MGQFDSFMFDLGSTLGNGAESIINRSTDTAFKFAQMPLAMNQALTGLVSGFGSMLSNPLSSLLIPLVGIGALVLLKR